MNHSLIFYPVLAQIFLTFFAYIQLTAVKNKALKTQKVDLERRALHKDAWPEEVIKVTNNIQNQFESPVLFYALSFMLWAIDSVTLLSLGLAWAYTLLRFVHYYVHTGSNFVPVRKTLFMVSTLTLLALAVYILVGLLGA